MAMSIGGVFVWFCILPAFTPRRGQTKYVELAHRIWVLFISNIGKPFWRGICRHVSIESRDKMQQRPIQHSQTCEEKSKMR